jgi:hypothetical protein
MFAGPPVLKINGTEVLLQTGQDMLNYEYNDNDYIEIECIKERDGTLHWQYCGTNPQSK